MWGRYNDEKSPSEVSRVLFLVCLRTYFPGLEYRLSDDDLVRFDMIFIVKDEHN